MGTTAETLEKWCSAPGIEFINKEAKTNYLARAKRIADAIQLKKPDRIPVIPSFSMFPALDNGLSVQEAMYASEKTAEVWKKTMTIFQPDAMMSPVLAFPGASYDVLQYLPLKIPGRDLPADYIYQFVEKEYIKAEDFYDAYLADPTDFMLRTFLPTVCKSLKPLSTLPNFATMTSFNSGILDGARMMAQHDVIDAFHILAQAGGIVADYDRTMKKIGAQMASMGFPVPYSGTTSMPFDSIGDWFRGTKGLMMDIYRCPDKVKAVMARRVPVEINYGISIAKHSGAPLVGIMLHKGSRRFLSKDQFKEFYWPGLREVMLGLINAGFVPMALFEGDYNGRLDIIRDLPEGKAIYWFEEINIYEAKKTLGDRFCIRGNVPGTLLQFGTQEQVSDYVKELIDVFGRDGGLIVDCGIYIDNAKHENIKAMIETTKTYGVL